MLNLLSQGDSFTELQECRRILSLKSIHIAYCLIQIKFILNVLANELIQKIVIKMS